MHDFKRFMAVRQDLQQSIREEVLSLIEFFKEGYGLQEDKKPYGMENYPNPTITEVYAYIDFITDTKDAHRGYDALLSVDLVSKNTKGEFVNTDIEFYGKSKRPLYVVRLHTDNEMNLDDLDEDIKRWIKIENNSLTFKIR